ncbi:MAG: RagB/SusD family nutrient uptake outer membrane protein [Candidatus Azobacteroides sp.]|nr:RagB/SusD family nutrient uptake outer membrane protein [Candidatus Azobacteroides sp.]
MKKYISILFALVGIVGVTSCDDILDTDSNSVFTEETVFKNYDFALKAVNGIYAEFMSVYMYGNNLIFFKLGNDIEVRTGALNGERVDLAQYAADPGNSALAPAYRRFYQSIERANICIEGLPKSPVWTGDYAKEARVLYAEAVALRAFCYSELISFWGDVPFKTKPTQAGDNFYLPKTDRDEMYEYLIQDLRDIQDDIPWMNTSAERVTKGFVKGLRAKMALAYAGYSLRNGTLETRRGRHWEEYYKIANQECFELIESGVHKMNPDYENIFRLLHTYAQDASNKEILWELAFGRGSSGRLAQAFGMTFSTNPADPKYGRAVAEPSVPFSYYYSFDPTDLRRSVNVELYNYSDPAYPGQQRLGGATALKPCKWRRSWIVPNLGGDNRQMQATGVNFPVMRYTDVLLMFAETENEINGMPTEAAKDALRQVRERAFPREVWQEKVTDYINRVSGSKESFFNAIVDERAWEFGGELIRKNDLIRWNLLGEKVEKMKSDCWKILDDHPDFSWVPDVIYWKYKNDNETLDILNPDYRWPEDEEAPEGYFSSVWGPAFSEANRIKLEDFLNECISGYRKEKNNHLFPLSATTITDSNGVLSNDQIPD